jgi:hypothetical protein
MKVFVKKNELKLENGGYLTFKGKPVVNKEFIEAQLHAEWVVTFSNNCKGKTFTHGEIDNIDDIAEQTNRELNERYIVKHLEDPKPAVTSIQRILKAEAMDFMRFQEEKSHVDALNEFLQKFNILKDFEDFGLFFEEGIEKLEKIYTLEEIVEAVKDNLVLLK